MTAPELRLKVDAAYPPAALAARQEGSVVLLVTVGSDGSVAGATVAESAGEAFDRAALDAVRQWRFAPARRGDEALVSRIRVPFRFALPTVEPTTVEPTAPSAAASSASGASASDAAATPAPHADDAREPIEVTVYGQRAPARGSSDFQLERQVLAVAPQQAAGELLSRAPGVYVSRPEGDAVAHQIYLRGFDAEHGQDIEFTVGSVPINQPSHIHGQGYADLNFVIPEVVRSLRVTEGVYDPRQGDFAVAGSAHFELGVEERGYRLQSTYGSFGSFRQLVLWAPEDEPEETFGAVSIRRTDGFGMNRGSLAGGGIAQLGFRAPGGLRGLLHVAAHGARAGLAGVLRREDVDAGRVGFYDSYPDPSANAQSAFGTRSQVAVTLERPQASGARTHLAAWLMLASFRARENFTGYLQRARAMPQWVGRGDLIEQENRDLGLGAQFSHRSRRLQPARWLSGHVELGLNFRSDLIDQAQNLLQAPQNETWDRRVDASLRGSDVGVYGDLDFRITRYLALRGGVRADVLYYDIDDRLGNFIPSFQRESHIVGFRRNALGVAYGPRATLQIAPLSSLTLLASYGQGYRSPQARQLEEGENAPFARVQAFEGGFRLRAFGGDALTVTGAGYATFLSTDLAFDPEQGRVEQIGPTSRKGFAAHVLARPWPWALASVSATYVHATLDEPPPATPENPSPPYRSGQLLPYVPPLVVRADAGLERALFALGGRPVQGRIGAGFTLLSPRPLPYGRFADAVALLDLSASLRFGFVELGLEVFNLVDARYAATEYSFVSDWQTRAIPSLVPARHLAAGAPRTLLGSLGLHF